MTTRYIPHIIYATLLTTFSMHLLNHRKNAAEELAAYRARESILVDIISRLKSGENMTDAEIARLKYLGESRAGLVKSRPLPMDSKTGWKDTLMGKKGRDVEEAEFLRQWDEYVKEKPTKSAQQ